ncbi:MAG: hypothetical protein QMD08_03385 [Actinomycetota bacterium]|nr:hypothetical protein [Actinomycetota bacterium]
MTHLAVVADDGPFGVVKRTIFRQLKAVFLLEVGGTVEAKSLLTPSTSQQGREALKAGQTVITPMEHLWITAQIGICLSSFANVTTPRAR